MIDWWVLWQMNKKTILRYHLFEEVQALKSYFTLTYFATLSGSKQREKESPWAGLFSTLPKCNSKFWLVTWFSM